MAEVDLLKIKLLEYVGSHIYPIHVHKRASTFQKMILFIPRAFQRSLDKNALIG